MVERTFSIPDTRLVYGHVLVYIRCSCQPKPPCHVWCFMQRDVCLAMYVVCSTVLNSLVVVLGVAYLACLTCTHKQLSDTMPWVHALLYVGHNSTRLVVWPNLPSQHSWCVKF